MIQKIWQVLTVFFTVLVEEILELLTRSAQLREDALGNLEVEGFPMCKACSLRDVLEVVVNLAQDTEPNATIGLRLVEERVKVAKEGNLFIRKRDGPLLGVLEGEIRCRGDGRKDFLLWRGFKAALLELGK